MKTSIFRRLPRRIPFWKLAWPYALTVAVSLGAVWFSVAAGLHFHRTPLSLLYVAVFLSTAAGHAWTGSLSVAITAWGAWKLVLPGPVSRPLGTSDWISFAVYVAFALVTVAVLGMLKAKRKVLREKEGQLTDFMENATVGMEWLTEDGTILWANKAQASLLGYTVGEYSGKNIREFHACQKTVDNILRLLAGNERLKNYEVQLRGRDGSSRLVLLDADVFWNGGQFVHARCFLRDVTARRQAEQRLQASEEKYRTFIAAANDAIVVADAETGKIAEVNAKAEELLGRPAGELIGLDQTRLHPPEEVERYRELFQRAVEAGSAITGELLICRSDGTRLPVEISATVIRLGERRMLQGVFHDLSERRTIAEALATERNLLRTLIDNLPDYVYTKDKQSRYLLSNLANTRVLGAQTEDEVRNRTVVELCPNKTVEHFLADDARVIERGEAVFDREEPFLQPDGEERILLTTKLPLRGPDGQVNGLVGISKDITARKRADEALRRSEASLRLAQRIGRIGSWEADLKKGTLQWSEETYRIFGCWPDSYVPSEAGFFDLIHPDDRETVRKAGNHALKHGKYYSVDYRICRPDGFERYLVQQARIIRDEAGDAIQMLGTVQDITERKVAEEALRESEGRFRVLFERSPEAIFILDPHSTEPTLPILDCNEAACAQSGYARAELVGQTLSLVDNDMSVRPQVAALVGRLERGGMVQREALYQRKDGTHLHIESSMSLLVVGQRELILCMNRDMSERRKAENAIRELNEQLEARVAERTSQLAQANRDLEAFSYSISHDLRAPVRAISGFAHILAEDHADKLDGEMKRLLGVIANSASRMGQLIDDLLNFSRLGAQTIQARTVNMAALADSVIRDLVPDQGEAQAALHLDELPPAKGDESMLRQVFANLIGNALKFSRAARAPRVQVGSMRGAGEDIYFVRDNGVGFEMQYVDKLFQVFQRLHSVSQFEGTGVGLAIVHRIVLKHGGRVWAESSPGNGATFYFSLPSPGGTTR